MSNNTQDHNVPTTLTITLEEAALGKTELLQVPQREMCEVCAGTGNSWRSDDGTCASCGNKGWVELNKVVTVPIPAGIETGALLRIPGEGELDPSSETRRDLVLTIKVSGNKLFERRGKHLYTSVSLPQDQITKGTEVIVPTLLDGRKKLRIPSGTGSGAVFRMARLGLRSIESSERGDLFVALEASRQETTSQATNAHSASSSTLPPNKVQPSSLTGLKIVIGAIITLAIVAVISFIYMSGRNPEAQSRNMNTQPSSTPGYSPRTVSYPPAPVPTPVTHDPVSLPNGSDITPAQGPRGNNTLTIINDNYYDVAMKIVNNSTQKTRRFIYIRANSTAVIRNIPREVCVLRIMSGTDWDIEKRTFQSNRSFYEFTQTFDFRRIRWTVQLRPTLGGTLRNTPLSEEDFEDK